MQKRALYITALISAPISGSIVQLLAGDALFSIWDIPIALFTLLLIFAWYRLDTNAYEIKRGIRGNCAITCFTFIALPVYLFRTRGFLKGMAALGIFLGLNIAWEILDAVGAGITNLIIS